MKKGVLFATVLFLNLSSVHKTMAVEINGREVSEVFILEPVRESLENVLRESGDNYKLDGVSLSYAESTAVMLGVPFALGSAAILATSKVVIPAIVAISTAAGAAATVSVIFGSLSDDSIIMAPAAGGLIVGGFLGSVAGGITGAGVWFVGLPAGVLGGALGAGIGFVADSFLDDSIKNRYELHYTLSSEGGAYIKSGSCIIFLSLDENAKNLNYEIDSCSDEDVFGQREKGRFRIGDDGQDVFDEMMGQVLVVATDSIKF